MQDTVRLHIREHFSTLRTAALLFTHRNTVVNRLRRAGKLLPRPLAAHALDVGAALEAARSFTRGPSEPIEQRRPGSRRAAGVARHR